MDTEKLVQGWISIAKEPALEEVANAHLVNNADLPFDEASKAGIASLSADKTMVEDAENFRLKMRPSFSVGETYPISGMEKKLGL